MELPIHYDINSTVIYLYHLFNHRFRYWFYKSIFKGESHIFLAQTSGWHISQSALNFNFVYLNFNDLSGFVLLLTTIWTLVRLDHYLKGSKNFWDLVLGLYPMTNMFFFQFIGSRPPDIPIYCLTLKMISLFVT